MDTILSPARARVRVVMVSAIFVPVKEMLTNSHGKTDWKATAELAFPPATATEGQPGTALCATEATLLDAWKEVVHAEFNEVTNALLVTEYTSIFELGGKSLLSVKLQMLISIRFNMKITLVDLSVPCHWLPWFQRLRLRPKQQCPSIGGRRRSSGRATLSTCLITMSISPRSRLDLV